MKLIFALLAIVSLTGCGRLKIADKVTEEDWTNTTTEEIGGNLVLRPKIKYFFIDGAGHRVETTRDVWEYIVLN